MRSGRSAIAQGDLAEAERLYRDSLQISRQIGDAQGTFALTARLGQMRSITNVSIGRLPPMHWKRCLGGKP